MLITEWNQEEAIAVAREEGIEIGVEKTREEERKNFLELLHQGLSIDEMIQRLENV